jgi:uncharacterized membrane protein YjjP (DUF1212 family)
MSHEHHDSVHSAESDHTVGTQHSDETLRGSEEFQNGEAVEERRREPRVRFRSFVDTGQEETQDLAPERTDYADHGRPPYRRPSPPKKRDSDASQDITDTSVNDRARPPEEQADRNLFKKAQKLLKIDVARDKARRLATRLGRPLSQGDALTSSVRESDWAGEGGVPLSDLTDNGKKSDDDRRRDQHHATSEAHRLVREMTQAHKGRRRRPRPAQPSESGRSTPAESDAESELPRAGGGGILSNLLKLYGAGPNQSSGDVSRQGGSRAGSTTDQEDGNRTPGWASPRGDSSGTETPRREKLKWYKKPQNQSTTSLVGAASHLSATASPYHSSEILSSAAKRRSKSGKPRLEDEIRVTVHIAEIISRQRYLMQLCRALMKFGAPTHRLEEYMQMTARVLEVDGQFLYLPGCMIMSFDDPSTRTTEVKLVRVPQGVDLSRLADTHSIYKNVVHDLIGVEEATQQLDEVMKRKPRFPTWFLIFMYGLASATVGPFAFSARPIDMPIAFILGCMLGVMQLVISARSALYSNVFEVFASVLTSFLARAFGSIRWGMVNGQQQYLFCFSAIAQSAIALILPGFLVLSSSLELQSHQIIAGSIRMVYAIIYSLFLGYGITTGTTIYGLMDGGANSNTSCPASPINNQYLQRFPFVVAMAFWLVIINQGKFKQAPVMVIIALAGYVVNYMCTKRIGSNSEVANTLGAFTIGVLGNLYSRLWHGHAATAILPAIFVLVPSGLASSGSLISGVQSANQIRSNVTGKSNASTSGGGAASVGGGTSTAVFNLGFGMVQVAIGITVGLFLAALIIYPYGKRRSGLFSF